MSHDFANKPKPKGKTRKSTSRKSKVPGWVWLLTGIVTGLFIQFLVNLTQVDPAAAPKPKADNKPTADQKVESTTQFDFYTLLPEREVLVPVDKEEQRPQEAAAKLQYILQAGSFRNGADADRLRAQLILLGLEARVDAVSVEGGDVWHRVQVGPFTSRSKLAKARSTLINEGIDTLLLKRKIEG